MRSLATAALAAGFIFCASTASAAELVHNGDFSAGDTGFSSTYTDGVGTPYDGSYYLTTNPSGLCGCFAPIGDHTSGSQNMLALDGAESGGYFWSQTFAVEPNQDYHLSLWASELGYAGPQAAVVATVNGTQVLDSGGVDYSTGVTSNTWHQYTATFNSGAATSVTLRLFDGNTAYYYNDFAVDDVSVTGPVAGGAGGVPEPAAWAMMVAGFLGAGAMLRTRKAITP